MTDYSPRDLRKSPADLRQAPLEGLRCRSRCRNNKSIVGAIQDACPAPVPGRKKRYWTLLHGCRLMRNFGKYRLLEILGYGGMARVFKAIHLEQKVLWALKLLRPREMMVHLLGEREVRRRFIDEARIMSELRHPHIASVYETGEYAGHLFFAQEYLCFNLGMLIGESEFAERPSRPVSPFTALRVASQTLDGLAALHEAGIVHRDIKPANLMLTRQGDVRIIDFGLFRRKGRTQTNPSGMMVGSPYYAAPEQEKNPDAADPRADLYSVGVVLFRMVTGRLPESRRAHKNHSFLLGNEWAAFLETALADDPDKRFAGAFEMINAIDALRHQWEKRREQVCRLAQSETPAIHTPASPVVLRREPVRTGNEKPPVSNGLNRLLQPAGHIENAFEENDDGTLDRSTHLVWGINPSDKPLDLEQALCFVSELNGTPPLPNRLPKWRIPTIDEIASLLAVRNSLEEYCAPPMRQLRHVRWLWSADMKTRKKNWIVDLEQGAVMPLDRMCRVHVLPVRDSNPKPP